MGGACCSEGLALLFGEVSEGRPCKQPRANSLPRCSWSGLLEKYEISQELLGTGSFGVIRRAMSRRTGAPCALKSLEKRCLPDSALHDLANEIRIQGACCHPNIVQIIESGEDVEHYHIAMEACEGGDLRDFMYDYDYLGERHSRIVLQQVLDAVHYLHEDRHVAHRDLKLENLLLTYRHVPLDQNVVKVTDFGMAASFMPGENSLSLFCGTPEYLAPEVVHGSYNEKCDVWSCGIILYEILVGNLPFDADSPGETMWLARVSPLALKCSHVSEEAKALLRHMCRKDPRCRPSARETLLSSWLRGSEQPVPQKPELCLSGLSLGTLDVSGDGTQQADEGGKRRSMSSPTNSEAMTTETAFLSTERDGSKSPVDLDSPSASATAESLPDQTWEVASSGDENCSPR